MLISGLTKIEKKGMNTKLYLFTKPTKFLTKSKKSVVDPQRDWFKKDLKDFFLDTLNSSEFKSLDYFNYKEIIKNYSKLIKGEINTSFNIFQIITFFFFYKNFNNGKIDNQYEKFQK